MVKRKNGGRKNGRVITYCNGMEWFAPLLNSASMSHNEVCLHKSYTLLNIAVTLLQNAQP